MKKFIYYDNKLFHFEWENPFWTMNKLKGVFKPLKRYFVWGRNIHPPVIYCSKLEPIFIRCRDLEWKDKWNTPRYEEPPHIWIYLFGLHFFWYWDLPKTLFYNPKKDIIDDYWEQALWYLYYASYNRKKKGYDELDINKARNKWPWRSENNTSSWNNKFLMK